MRRVLALAVITCIAAGVAAAFAQSAPEAAAPPAAPASRILLVLPFDNRSGQGNLEWVREAAAEIVSSRLTSAGYAPMSRADRLYALDHLGLPQGFQPSRASSLKLAQTLDADCIIVGDYLTDGSDIVAEARIVDVPHLRMGPLVSAQGEMRNMIAVFDSLAWKLARQLDPSFSVAEETFVAAGAGLRLDAFEQYIRGITEPDQSERLRHLKSAVQLSPQLSQAWMALGREYFVNQEYDQAATAFSRVQHNEADALEAGFYRGLSLLYSGSYAGAQKAFADVALVLPLAEVLNNEGVAISRRGADGLGQFRQAEAADPNAADYHFNIAVTLKRRGDAAGAQAELTQALRMRPTDTEAQALQRSWSGQASPDDANPEPLERIERRFDAVAFRQAAAMMDQMNAARLAALPPPERARKMAERARGYLDRGLLLEAERLYLDAVAVDNSVAEAHAGLAEVRERTGDAEDARKEARAALDLAASAQAYLVLGRLDLADNRLSDARNEDGEALKLEPGSHAAEELRRAIASREPLKQ